MSCLAHDGASYHESPISTSGLPSLFTSATATPSERNLPSMVVFFHETGVALSSSAPAGRADRRRADRPRAALVQVRRPMLEIPSGRRRSWGRLPLGEADV